MEVLIEAPCISDILSSLKGAFDVRELDSNKGLVSTIEKYVRVTVEDDYILLETAARNSEGEWDFFEEHRIDDFQYSIALIHLFFEFVDPWLSDLRDEYEEPVYECEDESSSIDDDLPF